MPKGRVTLRPTVKRGTQLPTGKSWRLVRHRPKGSKAKRDLGWAPQYRDEDMLIAAYNEYHAKKSGQMANAAHAIAAE